MAFPIQNMIVQKPGTKKHKAGALDVPVALYATDGTPFGPSPAPKPAPTLTGIQLQADKDGRITGGTATFSDKSTVPVTVTGPKA